MIIGRSSLSIRAVLTLLLILLASAAAQTTYPDTTLTPIVTEHSSLTVPTTIGPPAMRDGNASGAAIVPFSSALFFRPAASTTQTRIIQMGDPMPGLPNTRVDTISAVRVSPVGHVAFGVNYSGTDGISRAALLAWDGTSVRTVVLAYDPAPGTSGANFGRTLNLTGMDSAGDVAFSSPLADATGTSLNQTTLFIVPDGGSPLRIIGYGDQVPGMPAGTAVASFATATSMNSLGQVAMSITTSGTVKGTELALATLAGVQKVVATGDLVPGSTTVTFGASFAGWRYNQSGQMTFGPATSPSGGVAIYLYKPATGISLVVASGDPAPVDIGGTLDNSSSFTIAALNDSGAIAFYDTTTGGTLLTTSRVLFRIAPGGPLQTIAYAGQAAPGTSSTFTGFVAQSMNASGQLAFIASLSNNSYGLFGPGGAQPVAKVIVDGDPTPLAGGGSFSVYNGSTPAILMEDDGSIFFNSNIQDGVADYGEFLFVPGTGILTRMSTADPLPTGSRLSLRTFGMTTAGNYVGYIAAMTGGRPAFYTHDLQTGADNLVATDGGIDLSTGKRIRLVGTSTLFINAKGQVPYLAQFQSAGGAQALYLWDPAAGQSRLASTGDVDNTIPTLPSFISLSIATTGTALPVNDAGQVVFTATLSDGRKGFYVASPGVAARRVVLLGTTTNLGDASPAGGNFVYASAGTPVINQAGYVAFFANFYTGVASYPGIFIAEPAFGMAKIAAYNDPGPGPAGTTFNQFSSSFSFNDRGEVAFIGGLLLGGNFSAGVFVGTASSAPLALALQGAAAPSGGNFGPFSTYNPDVRINNNDDLVFRAPLTGGTTDSGYFIRRGGQTTLRTIFLQGDPAAGTSLTFATASSSLNGIAGENFTLSDSGDVYIANPLASSGIPSYGVFRFSSANLLEKVFQRGDIGPGGGNLVASINQFINSTGSLSFWGAELGASASYGEAIYAVASPSTDLSVYLFGPSSATGGVSTSYGFIVFNAGPWTATGVVATFTLPPNVTVGSLRSGCTLSSDQRTITCQVSELGVQASIGGTLYITAATTGPVTISASVAGNQTDSFAYNNLYVLNPGLTTATPILTNLSSLPVSSTFAITSARVMNSSGDYAFVTNGSALFYRAAGAASATRLLQMGDPIPGFPGSRCDTIQSLGINTNGRLVFRADFFGADAITRSGLFTWDGSAFHSLTLSTDSAPGVAGAIFGRAITPIGMDAAGDVAFLASLTSTSGVNLSQPTLFIVPAGGTPQRILGFGDAAVGISGTITTLAYMSSAMNASGQVLLQLGTSTGAHEFVLAALSAAPQKVAATTDIVPGGTATFADFSRASYFLNSVGQVAFGPATGPSGSDYAIYLYTPASGVALIAYSGETASSPLSGTLGMTGMTLMALNNSGVTVFKDSISAMTGSQALFQADSAGTLSTVAAWNQAAPGTSANFSNFDGVSINNTGQISFRAALSTTPASYGIFQQLTPGGAITPVVLDNTATPLPGAGNFGLSYALSRILTDGSVFFLSDILGGGADYAEFVALAGGGFKTLMNTQDALPPGARISLRNLGVGGGSTYLSFLAGYSGGPQSMLVYDINSSAVTKVVAPGDIDPVTGGKLRLTSLDSVFVNQNGQVPYTATLLTPSGVKYGVYLWDPSLGVSKVALSGDSDLASGSTFSSFTMADYVVSPLNAYGQIVFQAKLADGRDGIYVGAPGAAPAKIALSGDSTPAGGAFNLSSWQGLTINNGGVVVFFATFPSTVAGCSTSAAPGIFYSQSRLSPLQAVAVCGTPSPDGGLFRNFPTSFSVSDYGDVLFFASLDTAPGSGLFVGGGSPDPYAAFWNGFSVALNGDVSPAGGSFLIPTAPLPVDARIDSSGTTWIFRSALSGASGNSGYFISRSYGPLQTILVQGQAAPGTTTTFASASSSLNGHAGESFSLSDAGESFIETPVATAGAPLQALFRFRTDDVLDKVFVRGEPAFGSGGTFGGSSQNFPSTGDTAFAAYIVGGMFTDALYRVTPIQADMALTAVAPSQVTPGVPADYTFTATNNGPWSATNVVAYVNLSAGGAFATIPQGCSVPSGSTVLCNVGTTAPGESSSGTFGLTADSLGGLSVIADIAANEYDPVATNNVVNLSTQAGSYTDLAVSLPSPPLFSGGNVTYHVDVTNNGPSDATGAVFTATLDRYTLATPSSASFIGPSSSGPCSYSAPVVTCVIGSLPFGVGPAMVTLTVTPPTSGWASLNLHAMSAQYDTNPTNNSAQIGPITDAYNTATGQNVLVSTTDAADGISAALTFSTVTRSGMTSATPTRVASLPPGFRTGNPALIFDLSTSAQFTAPVYITLHFPVATFRHPAKVRLWHLENGFWVDRTTGINVASGTISAVTTSFSPFALLEPLDIAPVAAAGSDRSVTGISAAGTRVLLDGSASADADGDALSYHWTGPFPEGNGVVAGVSPAITLPVGTSRVTLVVNDGEVDSAPATVNVSVSDFSLSLPQGVTVKAGQAATVTVSVSPQYGAFDAAVNLSCANPPAGVSCAFSPAALQPGAQTATATLTITTGATFASRRAGNGLLGMWLALPVGVLWLGAGLSRKQRVVALLLLVLIIAVHLGCGGGNSTASTSSSSATSGTLNVVVSGTSGSLQHSATTVVQLR